MPTSQEIEFTQKHIIIRNVPKCECFRSIVSNFLIHTGYCKSLNDIKMLDSDIWIIERMNNKYNCECNPKSFKKISIQANKEQKPNTCHKWCDYFAIAGSAWCAKVFKRYDCQVGCC